MICFCFSGPVTTLLTFNVFYMSKVNQLKDLEKRIVVISKENEDLKEKIRMLNIARDEDKQKRNSLEAENTRMASQLEAFGMSVS